MVQEETTTSKDQTELMYLVGEGKKGGGAVETGEDTSDIVNIY